MKIRLCIMLFIMSFINIRAQQIDITGTIFDLERNPIEYANVQLLNEDSVFIQGTISDLYGKIKMQANSDKSYWLVISITGYVPSIFYLKDIKSDIILSDIILEESTTMLDSITVTANRTIHKIDRQITFPSMLQRKSSNNALDLLYKMALPRVIVNPTNSSVSLIGNQNILLRINGVNASVNEIASIPVKDIIRVEYYDNPGVRFQENAMIDFIVKRRKSGGYLSTDLTNSPHVGYGNNMLVTKLNYKNSQWSALYYLSYRDYKKRETESTATFMFPDKSIVRQSIGIPSPFNYQTHNLNLTYNYTLANKRLFNITISSSFYNNNGYDKSLNYYSARSDIEYLSSTESKSKSKNPYIDLYYKESLSKRQILLFNLVGGYINSNHNRNYQEKDRTNKKNSKYYSDITGNKYSIIGEGVHQMKWEKVHLYSGIKFSSGNAENKYIGTIAETTSLKNNDIYIYTQLQGKIKKIFYGLGVGLSYASFSDKNEKFSYWTFRPFLSLAYPMTKQMNLQYIFNINPAIPSLGSLSDVSQVIDQYQVSKGNPNLKPYRVYTNMLRANYQKNIFQCNLGVSHQLYKNAIMEDIYFDKTISQFVYTNINQKFYQKTAIDGGVNWQIIKDYLSLNLNGQVCWMESKGYSYTHKFTSYYYGGQLNFSIKQWTANFGANSRFDNLWGETVSYGEWWSNVEVNYRYKELNIGLACINFLTNRWSAGNKKLSTLVPSNSWTYIDDSAPKFCIHLSWAFSWGKQTKTGKKTLENKDSDSGILKVE